MTIALKILLSLILIGYSLFQVINFFPTTFHFVIPTLKTWHQINTIIGIGLLLTLIVLLTSIWKNKEDNQQQKTMWTVLIILIPPIFGIIYIWKQKKQS